MKDELIDKIYEMYSIQKMNKYEIAATLKIPIDDIDEYLDEYDEREYWKNRNKK